MTVPADQKFSGFADGGTLIHDDIVVGLRDGINTRFSFQGDPGVYLPLAGGTMAGAIIMDGNSVTGLPVPSNPSDAATKAYVDATEGAYLPLAGGTMSGAINMGSHLITSVTNPVSAQDAATKAYVDSTAGAYLPLAGGTMTGDIVFATGKGLKSGTTLGNTLLLQAYNTNTASYTAMGTMTAGNPPTFDLTTTTTIGGAYIYRVGGTDVAVADGGTGASTLTNHGILLGQGTSAVTALTLTNNQIVIGNTGADPSASTLTSLMDSVFGSAQGDLLYRNAAGWVVLAPGTSGQFLQTQGAAADPLWVTSSTVTPAALTRVNDTNVTLTLGGTPTTALLQATSLTLGWTGTLAETRGGTAQSTYALGDTLYASAANTLSKLAGNITAVKQYLSQTGSGAVSAAPAWATIAGTDITGAALTKVDDTNVTMTLGGTPTTALLRAASITLGWTGQLGLTRGGTAASLTASNGGIVYSNASTLAILAGTATAQQLLLSGASTTPQWSTTTYPLTNAINTIMYASSANVMGVITPANSSVMVSSAGGVPSWSTTLPSGLTIPGYAASGANADITSLTGLTGAIQHPTAIQSSASLNLLTFTYVASAVNYFAMSNNITGSNPILDATGSDSSVNMNLRAKNGDFFLSDLSGTKATILRLFNAAGTFGVGLRAPTAQGTSPTFVLMGADGTAKQAIITDASGNLSFGVPTGARIGTQYLTTTGTYTPTTGTKTIVVRGIGGGGGGSGTGTAGSSGGGNGGDTSFNTNTIIGKGGTGAPNNAGGAGGVAGTGSLTLPGSGGIMGQGLNANVINGGTGGAGIFGSGAGLGGSSGGAGVAGGVNTGGGGGGGGGGTTVNSGGGGGGGSYSEATLTGVTGTYSYTIGAAGSAGGAGTSGFAGGLGSKGLIIVEEYA